MEGSKTLASVALATKTRDLVSLPTIALKAVVKLITLGAEEEEEGKMFVEAATHALRTYATASERWPNLNRNNLEDLACRTRNVLTGLRPRKLQRKNKYRRPNRREPLVPIRTQKTSSK